MQQLFPSLVHNSDKKFGVSRVMHSCTFPRIRIRLRIQYWVKKYPVQNILIWLILLLPISSIRKQGKQPPALALILLGERRTCPQSCNFSEIIWRSTFFTFDLGLFMFWFNFMSSGFVLDAWCLACRLYPDLATLSLILYFLS